MVNLLAQEINLSTHSLSDLQESHIREGQERGDHVTDLKEKTKAELHPPQGKVNSLFSFSLRH